MTTDLGKACQKLWPKPPLPQALPSTLARRLLEASATSPWGSWSLPQVCPSHGLTRGCSLCRLGTLTLAKSHFLQPGAIHRMLPQRRGLQGDTLRGLEAVAPESRHCCIVGIDL